MRLLEDDGHGNLSLVEKHENDIPRYAILSHTWGADGDEVTFRDLTDGTGRNKIGYEKIEFCRAQATSDGLQYFWVDTCCIDKSSSAELSETINSMFRWYRNAAKCYVYLPDVSTAREAIDVRSSSTDWKAAFRRSRWFTRGWTLQELIAPASVEFFSREHDRLGSKQSLEETIHEITGITIEALRGEPLPNFKIKQRFSWAEHRETKRQEDKAYSLLGIFDIFMPLLYGEGREKAFVRLREAITKSLNPPVEQPETSPSPSSTVPFRRDADFVDRRTLQDRRSLLEQIEQRCAAPAARVGLVGIGGAGKSQLAIEYCYRLRERLPHMWVFWIHASNADRIEQGYREIAERVKIPGRKDPEENIFELVVKWLRDESKGTWLLVLDNLDDDAVLLTPQAVASDSDGRLRRPLSTYLPQSQNGAILVTSRTRSVAIKLVEPRDVIPVEPMNDQDAIALLEKKLDQCVNDGDLKELVDTLEYMPLAIVQAAAYISQKEVGYSIRQYIKAFQTNEKQKTSLLEYEGGHLRRDPEAKSSIIITWQISFNDIREKWPTSANLLSLMSYFDRQGIPKELLKAQPQEEIRNQIRQEGDRDVDKDMENSGGSDASGDDIFEKAVDRLRSYSFVSVGEHGRTFEMHGLVQLAMRKWLEMHGEDEKWKAQFCIKLNKVFPTGDYKNWALCETLFPHAKSAERQRPTENASVREWAQILQKAGWYACARGDYGEAERMCEKSAEAMRKVLGEEHRSTLSSIASLASIYWKQGRWKEAEKLDIQVMETSKRVLGEEHPSTLSSIAHLASTYRKQGRWTEAEKMQVQVMETRRRLLREEHPLTLNSMANLASTFWKQGRWKEAEKLDIQVMETSKRVLGEEHPSTLDSIASLASTYRKQRRWTEAEKMDIQVMETRRRLLGEEHPSTLSSIANLASIYWNQRRWKEAEKLDIQVMETRRRLLGEEHPSTLDSIASLASTYRKQRRWTEAEKMDILVMETRRRLLGEEHPSTLSSIANLTSIYRKQGRWIEAEKMQVQVIEMRKRVLGEGHPSTLNSMANLASTYRNQNRWLEAEKMDIQVMETRRRLLGEEHPSTLDSIASLALTYRKQGRWTETEKMQTQVMETSKRVLGEEHPSTLSSMNDLAFTMKEQHRNGEAIKLMAECVRLGNQILGIEHPDALSSAAALAKWQSIE